ncbi:MAG: VPLPA-CTERM sorting domain-containing protein [Bdellovibrionales bacterium]
MRSTLIASILGILLAVPAASANASSISYLDIISSPSIGGGALGTVELTQANANEVGVKVTLEANTKFVYTGGPHHAFTFSLNLANPYSIAINSPSGFAVTSPSPVNTPYGIFTSGIDCPGCGPGASHAKSGPLEFSVFSITGISISNFIANASGYFFSADVLGPAGGTGNIASGAITTPPSSVPLPAALPLFAAGLLGLAANSRRKKAAT